MITNIHILNLWNIFLSNYKEAYLEPIENDDVIRMPHSREVMHYIKTKMITNT